jgi:hypothetical protein
MSLIRKLRLWCPQPRKTVPINFVKISPLIVTVTVLTEILILLIAPIAYYSLLAPKPSYGINQEFPLTNKQIQASWPNLPTIQEIQNSSNGYGSVLNNSYTGSSIVNCTIVNVLYFGSFSFNGTVPIMPSTRYDIFLDEGNTSWSKGVDVWIQVPPIYLTTNHPPPIPAIQNGFLDTGLPTAYVTIAAVAIVATLLAGTTYLLRYKKVNSA